VRAFRLPQALHIGRWFNKSSGISNTLLSLEFGILLLLRLILLAFPILILRVVGLIERALSVVVIFSYLLLFVGVLANNLQLSNPPQRLSSSCCSQILWIVHTMRDFGVSIERVPLMCDNTNAISVAKNPIFHKKMRHVERRHHFLRDHVEK
jgi:hypothetical protein